METETVMTNRLGSENSLYLRQHAENPVDWYPWGREALETARREDKPLLVSIGYSACHWCHVMAHECFEDAHIADLMNKHFVCVKVDREELPDVDQVYMEAVQMIQRHGGWPLNVFCLPDGRPFFGGTYFPPEDRGHGMVPWPQVLLRVSDYYRRARHELEENAEAIRKNIEAAAGDAAPSGWSPEVLVRAAHGICGNHDDRYGGFGGAPKFPPAMALDFLRALRRSEAVEAGDRTLAGRIDEVTHTTLRAMAHGGLFDQFGGGFARYSVDAHWLIPHFEKMLYDNALLIDAYTRGWLDNRAPLYADVVAETVAWLEREMLSPAGAFYASLDADSDGEEGRFYVWTPDEVKAAVGDTVGAEVCAAYHITEEGNFEGGRSNPALVEADYAVRERLAPARRKLREYREAHRGAPGRDTKLNTAWNCLLARSLAEAGFYFGRSEWLERAQGIMDFIFREMTYVADGLLRLRSVYYEEAGPRVEGYLHDYALAADACLAVAAKVDWLAAGSAPAYVERAGRLLASADRLFADPDGCGHFFTASDARTPVARRKEWFDNATPSGNSALLHASAGLFAATGDPAQADRLDNILPAYREYAEKVAAGVAHALEAAATHAIGAVVVHVAEEAAIEPLRAALAGGPWRRTFVFLDGDAAQGGRYQLCAGTRCLPATDSVEAVVEAL